MADFTRVRDEDGVTERLFALNVAGENVPAVIWSPQDAHGARPLVLLGHGGSQHKKIGTLATRARQYVKRLGYAVAAIDAPGHGDRVSREQAASLAQDVGTRIRERRPMSAEMLKTMAERTRQAVPEWKAALDLIQTFDFVGDGLVGYWGVSMGTAIGVPFVASEPRIKCAIFGLAGMRPGAAEFEKAARSITIPLEFVFQWDDEVAPRETGVALFDAFGATEKSMHINPGGHMGIPNFEGAHWQSFFTRHLGLAKERMQKAA